MNKDLLQAYVHPLLPVKTSLRPTGRLKAPVQCVLFDIYGTLFISDSGDIGLAKKNSPRRGAIEKLLQKFSVRQTPAELVRGLYSTIESVHDDLGRQGIDFPEVEIDRIWAQVLQHSDMDTVRQFAVEFELIVNPAYPMPHLARMLADCKARQLLLGIISNAQFYTPLLFRWFLNLEPEQLGFNKEIIYYSYQYNQAKPSPALFSMAAEKLLARGIPPTAVLYLGNDMLNDIHPARTVGFQTALFAGDQRSLRLRQENPRCRDLIPDLIITDLDQLVPSIDHTRRKT